MSDNLNQHWNQSIKCQIALEAWKFMGTILSNCQGGLPVSIMEVN